MGTETTPASSLIEARRQKRIREQLRDAIAAVRATEVGTERDKRGRSIRQYMVIDEAEALLDYVDRLETALREIGLPQSVPEHFDPLDWWRHTACKRGEMARNALGVTAEELILNG